MLQVRKAETIHADGVAASLAQLHFEDHAPFDQARVLALIESGTVYVAIEESAPGEDAVQGAMVLAEEHRSYRISALGSRLGAERLGAGRTLVEYAIRRCEQKGVPKLWCWSLDLYNAKGFYERLGFTEAHRLEKQFFGKDCWFLGRVIELSEGQAKQGES